MIGTLLYVFGSCERHAKLTEEITSLWDWHQRTALFVVDCSINLATGRNFQTKALDKWKVTQLNISRQEGVKPLSTSALPCKTPAIMPAVQNTSHHTYRAKHRPSYLPCKTPVIIPAVQNTGHHTYRAKHRSSYLPCKTPAIIPAVQNTGHHTCRANHRSLYLPCKTPVIIPAVQTTGHHTCQTVCTNWTDQSRLFCSGWELDTTDLINSHMYNKFKVGESEMCPCNADIKTAEHLLQHCRLHDTLRRDMCPKPTLLRDKLYGNL